MKKEKEPRLEVIRWRDHCSLHGSGWKTADSVKNLKPCSMIAVGYVINETDAFVTLISAFNEDGDNCQGEICIIKSAIVKRWRLPNPIKE